MKPIRTASKRTKERFRAHSPFKIEAEGFCLAFGDKECFLLRSEKTDWAGWIPKEEIEFVP